MAHRLLIPVTPGELLDRISILRIKSQNIKDPLKVGKVSSELKDLSELWYNSPFTQRMTRELVHLIRELDDVNQQIWDAENLIRSPDLSKGRGVEWAATRAREANTKRTELKSRINTELDLETTEVKDYGGTHETQGQGG